MEERLKDLKEEFCKWYCDGKDTDELCYYCRVEEYIRFIRDEIDKK